MKTDGSNKTTLRENIGSLVHDIKLFHQGRQTGQYAALQTEDYINSSLGVGVMIK